MMTNSLFWNQSQCYIIVINDQIAILTRYVLKSWFSVPVLDMSGGERNNAYEQYLCLSGFSYLNTYFYRSILCLNVNKLEFSYFDTVLQSQLVFYQIFTRYFILHYIETRSAHTKRKSSGNLFFGYWNVPTNKNILFENRKLSQKGINRKEENIFAKFSSQCAC